MEEKLKKLIKQKIKVHNKEIQLLWRILEGKHPATKVIMKELVRTNTIDFAFEIKKIFARNMDERLTAKDISLQIITKRKIEDEEYKRLVQIRVYTQLLAFKKEGKLKGTTKGYYVSESWKVPKKTM